MDWEWNGRRYPDVGGLAADVSRSSPPVLLHHGATTLSLTWEDGAATDSTPGADIQLRRRCLEIKLVAVGSLLELESAAREKDCVDLPWSTRATAPVDLTAFHTRLAELLEKEHKRIHEAWLIGAAT
jgi:hypothetical protein